MEAQNRDQNINDKDLKRTDGYGRQQFNIEARKLDQDEKLLYLMIEARRIRKMMQAVYVVAIVIGVLIALDLIGTILFTFLVG